MKPTDKQIALYKQIREITEQHHAYSDQMIAVANWIDAEFEQKTKRTEQQRSSDKCTLYSVSNSFSVRENIFYITFEVGAVWSRTYQSAGKDIDEALEKIFREYPDYKGCRYLHNEYEPRMVQIFS